jgi:MscS family membrane protein
MNLESLIDQLAERLATDSWIVQVFAVLIVTQILSSVTTRVLRRLERGLRETRTFWDNALFWAANKPATVLIWLLGLSYAIDIAHRVSGAAIFGLAGPLRSMGVIAVLMWFLLRFIRRAETSFIAFKTAEDVTFDKTTVLAISKLLRVSVLITGLLVILQTMGFSISGVLAFGGIGGIAIGFAAKDLLANFFGGLMIYMDRPFNVGDWVRSPDREIEGTVEEIGWRLTRIRTFDKRPLYLPNSIFNTISIENPSRMTNRRIYETVGIRYEDAGKMAAITSDVKAMLKAHPEIDQSGAMIVNFNTFAASSLDFFVYAMTKTTNWFRYHEVKEDVLLKILEIIEKHGAECAFPTSTIHLAATEGLPIGAD